MTYEQLQGRAAYLAMQNGWINANPQPDWPALVNQAWAVYSWDAECVVGSESISGGTVIGQAEYALTTGPWKAIVDVYYNSLTGLRASSERYERQQNPDWYYAANGVPTRFLMMSAETLRLVPTPSAASIPILVRGITEGAAMVNLTDKPGGCPDRFHEAIALYAAWLHAKGFVSADADIARMAGFMKEFDLYVKTHRRYLAPLRARRAERIVDPMAARTVQL